MTTDSYEPATGCARLSVRADGAGADLGSQFDRVCPAGRQPRSCSATQRSHGYELTAHSRTTGIGQMRPPPPTRAAARLGSEATRSRPDPLVAVSVGYLRCDRTLPVEPKLKQHSPSLYSAQPGRVPLKQNCRQAK